MKWDENGIVKDWKSDNISFNEMLIKYNLKEYKLREIAKALNLPPKTRKKVQDKFTVEKYNQHYNFTEDWKTISIPEILDKTEKVFKKRLHDDTVRKWANKLGLKHKEYYNSAQYQFDLLKDLPEYTKIQEMVKNPHISLDEISNKITELGYFIPKHLISKYFTNESFNKPIEWTPERLHKFKEMWNNKDVKISQIQQEFGRELNNQFVPACQRTIIQKAEELNLPKRYFNPENIRLRKKKSWVQEVQEIHNNKYKYPFGNAEYLNSHSTITIECPEHGIFKQKAYHHKAGARCPKCAILGKSKTELDIAACIPSSINVVLNDRSVLDGKEIDIYVPEYKFGIEYNGLMWHSIGESKYSKFNRPDTRENRYQHVYKTNLAQNKGIQLFHIFENEWLDENKQSIWKSVINDKLGLNTKIGARKCEIREVQTKIANDFLNKNHLQGATNGRIKIGLFYDNDLVSLMTFSAGRQMSKDAEYELLRFCSKKGYTIQGGASKLFTYFVRKYNPKSVKSFANRRWSQGNLYQKLGFKLSHISNPNYFYFKPEEGVLYSRNMFQKKSLKRFKSYSKDKTEYQITLEEGYRRIYDSGNYVFIWKPSDNVV